MADREQKAYWESARVRKRRPITHPVVAEFARPKVDLLRRHLAAAGAEVGRLSVLDVGAGNGFLSHYLLEVFGRVVAVDFSATILDMNPVGERVLGDAGATPFATGSFDLVFCSNLLHHLRLPQLVVDEMARVARRFVVLSEPNRNNPLMFLFGLLVREEWGSLKFTRSYLEKLLAAARPPLAVLHSGTEGEIVPNKAPGWSLSLVKLLAPVLHPKLYTLAIADRV